MLYIKSPLPQDLLTTTREGGWRFYLEHTFQQVFPRYHGNGEIISSLSGKTMVSHFGQNDDRENNQVHQFNVIYQLNIGGI